MEIKLIEHKLRGSFRTRPIQLPPFTFLPVLRGLQQLSQWGKSQGLSRR